ncbi:MAG: hotdog fold domain-containing protein [Granulosicoccus sp.]
MSKADSTPAETSGIKLLRIWNRCAGLPLGNRLFSRILGKVIPYTGSIHARVDHLEPGHAIVVLPDRRRVRNHLNSVHAIALANMAELSTGLAMISGLPAGMNAILVGLNVSYEKKARGELRAECKCSVPDGDDRHEVAIDTEIRDLAGDVVTRATATWLVGPIKDR